VSGQKRKAARSLRRKTGGGGVKEGEDRKAGIPDCAAGVQTERTGKKRGGGRDRGNSHAEFWTRTGVRDTRAPNPAEKHEGVASVLLSVPYNGRENGGGGGKRDVDGTNPV